MSNDDIAIESVRFVVLDRPVCVWDPNLRNINLRFLQGLDPNFYLYQAQVHAAHYGSTSEGEKPSAAEATYAAIALRISYGMALESLFGILCALVQAPDCVFGWLSSYKNSELVEMVERISNNVPVMTLQPFRPATWENIALQLLRPLAHEPEQHRRVANLFSNTWHHFARDFCDPLRKDEYNSLKHSFRVEPTAFSVKIEHNGTPLLQSNSVNGHTFPYLKKNAGQKVHYSVSRATFAFEPQVYSAGLALISISINNAVAFARCRAGDDPGGVQILVPENDSLFEAFARREAHVQTMTFGGVSTPNKYWSNEEILAVYDPKSPKK